MDKARWQAAPRGVSKRHSLMALRILTPMGREPQKLFISREVHGSTVPFFFSPGPEPAIEGQYTLILGYGEPSIRGQRYSDLTYINAKMEYERHYQGGEWGTMQSISIKRSV
ncbi:hypothetical protein MGG_15562 [Pyricularia oryzae 70-15]|uniref:Uncharacterized protein n=3 Tax=Pyricularia oryzae TaxID=318829 RepID=G4MTD1_PYRO7|nr:uncharacterized protein MGG_15562 [Pyricularia oryzae 70-15]EHA53877.1 hypothetical protein MGG_15562 [Pyricularia oryzae 70-15]ELQ42778.1 hypothetical protein OOU_Y34scaffold00194g91 [Pyricularia oryzae Y34]